MAPAHTTPMTVLQVIPSLDTGGAERSCVEIAEALVDAGHRALVAGGPGRLVTALTDVGGEFVGFDGASKSPWTLYRNARFLAALIDAEGVDIVHARSRAPAWSARMAARRRGAAFVTTYHGIYGEQNRLKKLYNSVMASGDRVIANSGYTGDLVRERYDVTAPRLVVINRGVDERLFDPAAVSGERIAALRTGWGISGDTRAIVLAGRLTGWKGQSVLLHAAGRLRAEGRRDFRIVLVGSDQGRDSYRAELDRIVADNGLGDHVCFAGHSDDVPAVFASADIAVSASTKPEAFGRTIVEAGAMATPVIVTDLGPTRETVLAPPLVGEDARSGWIVPPGDADALAAALGEALGCEPATLAAIGARGRRHVLNNFTLRRMTASTLKVYEDVLAMRQSDH